ncbi:MAG: hypothetical protein LBB14_00335 [Puniceicoccales bacterium]|jgi:hypothetical protein|nr:hypothetical protein [Puniceicoccales bacterium]
MATEKSAPRLPLGDRLLLLLKRHGRLLIGGFVLAVLFALALCCRTIVRRGHLSRAQSRFIAAREDPDALSAFAARYGSLPLGALASYAVAGGAAERGDFAAAAAAYGRCGPLAVAKLDGFAAIAGALAAARSGESQSALDRLAAVAVNSAQPSVVRAGARYFQALLSMERGQPALAREALDALSRLPERGDWDGRATVLSLSLP